MPLSVLKRVLGQNVSYENEFDLHEHEPVEGTNFHMNGFAGRLVFTQRQKATREWPIVNMAVKTEQFLL